MKNGKKLLLLLLVLAVLVGATAIVGTISKNAADQEDETQTVFSLDPENVTNLGWDYSEKVSFTAGEDGWVEMTVDKITAYCTGTRTATGTTPKLGTIAVNTYYIPYGSEIYIKGYGYGTAQDTGAFRNYINDEGEPMNQLDIWLNTRSEAMRWGTKYDVTVLVRK